eukprot:c11140_g1_i1.p1 GENE.c11140_g1_i1~~c11140_g1_i1.p1  ORF type:complete len:1369 (+),score=333.76 c11140_g1_i1:52-4107(+)
MNSFDPEARFYNNTNYDDDPDARFFNNTNNNDNDDDNFDDPNFDWDLSQNLRQNSNDDDDHNNNNPELSMIQVYRALLSIDEHDRVMLANDTDLSLTGLIQLLFRKVEVKIETRAVYDGMYNGGSRGMVGVRKTRLDDCYPFPFLQGPMGITLPDHLVPTLVNGRVFRRTLNDESFKSGRGDRAYVDWRWLSRFPQGRLVPVQTKSHGAPEVVRAGDRLVVLEINDVETARTVKEMVLSYGPMVVEVTFQYCLDCPFRSTSKTVEEITYRLVLNTESVGFDVVEFFGMIVDMDRSEVCAICLARALCLFRPNGALAKSQKPQNDDDDEYNYVPDPYEVGRSENVAILLKRYRKLKTTNQARGLDATLTVLDPRAKAVTSRIRDRNSVKQNVPATPEERGLETISRDRGLKVEKDVDSALRSPKSTCFRFGTWTAIVFTNKLFLHMPSGISKQSESKLFTSLRTSHADWFYGIPHVQESNGGGDSYGGSNGHGGGHKHSKSPAVSVLDVIEIDGYVGLCAWFTEACGFLLDELMSYRVAIVEGSLAVIVNAQDNNDVLTLVSDTVTEWIKFRRHLAHNMRVSTGTTAKREHWGFILYDLQPKKSGSVPSFDEVELVRTIWKRFVDMEVRDVQTGETKYIPQLGLEIYAQPMPTNIHPFHFVENLNAAAIAKSRARIKTNTQPKTIRWHPLVKDLVRQSRTTLKSVAIEHKRVGVFGVYCEGKVIDYDTADAGVVPSNVEEITLNDLYRDGELRCAELKFHPRLCMASFKQDDLQRGNTTAVEPYISAHMLMEDLLRFGTYTPGARYIVGMEVTYTSTNRIASALVTVSDAPTSPVIAVSHVWGWQKWHIPCRVIGSVCGEYQGQTSSKAINLVLRLLKRGFSVWLDLLCINQQSGADKNAQVKVMGDIYKRAMVVGTGCYFANFNPSEQYTERGWIVQECLKSKWMPVGLVIPQMMTEADLAHVREVLLMRHGGDYPDTANVVEPRIKQANELVTKLWGSLMGSNLIRKKTAAWRELTCLVARLHIFAAMWSAPDPNDLSMLAVSLSRNVSLAKDAWFIWGCQIASDKKVDPTGKVFEIEYSDMGLTLNSWARMTRTGLAAISTDKRTWWPFEAEGTQIASQGLPLQGAVSGAIERTSSSASTSSSKPASTATSSAAAASAERRGSLTKAVTVSRITRPPAVPVTRSPAAPVSRPSGTTTPRSSASANSNKTIDISDPINAILAKVGTRPVRLVMHNVQLSFAGTVVLLITPGVQCRVDELASGDSGEVVDAPINWPAGHEYIIRMSAPVNALSQYLLPTGRRVVHMPTSEKFQYRIEAVVWANVIPENVRKSASQTCELCCVLDEFSLVVK